MIPPDDQHLEDESADLSRSHLSLEDKAFKNIFIALIAAIIVGILSVISFGLSRLFHKKPAKDGLHDTQRI
jgi:hypothetical protein